MCSKRKYIAESDHSKENISADRESIPVDGLQDSLLIGSLSIHAYVVHMGDDVRI